MNDRDEAAELAAAEAYADRCWPTGRDAFGVRGIAWIEAMHGYLAGLRASAVSHRTAAEKETRR